MRGVAKHRYTSGVLLTLLLALLLSACGTPWQVSVAGPDGNSLQVDAGVLRELDDFAQAPEGREAVPLERVLVAAGHTAVDTIGVTVEGTGALTNFEWVSVADGAWWLSDGTLLLGGSRLRASRLEVGPPRLLDDVEASIADIAPTAATALGLSVPSEATGRPLPVPSADRVALIFLDGFGYVRYSEALAEGSIPNLAALGEPLVALTTYPSITSVSTASLLTGASPDVHGVDQRGIRKTDTETLFDVATSAGLKVVAVEGESLSFALRGAELELSADLDGNGSTDDNVLASTLDVLRTGPPDVLFVHFHGIDDTGHGYGPGSPEESAAVEEVDSAVGRIVEMLPEGTLIVVFADHGMHKVEEEGRLGNHGYLLERDMFIPIFLVIK
ncbi:MAG TPA: alkaline phosphatase family protein [Anaerolineae bacterium]|nr:alkaline phosphatase family protein [Anaerolineae bacterium]